MIGVFVVYLAGGAIIALGPGQLLLSIVPKPTGDARHILEIVVGVAMIVAAALLWRNRDRLADRKLPATNANGKSAGILGATITAVELPTAFPYFAAIAAIVGSGLDPGRQLALLVLFNVCFVAPLVGIAATLWLAGKRANRMLSIGRDFLQRYWPVLLAGLALAAGLFVVLLGATGFGSRGHGRLGHLMRRLHHLLHP